MSRRDELRYISRDGNFLSFYHNAANMFSELGEETGLVLDFLGKRKRPYSEDGEPSSSSDGAASDLSDDEGVRKPEKKKKKTKRVVEVPMIASRAPPLAFPKSLYKGHIPPLPPCHEKVVLREITGEDEEQQANQAGSDEDTFIDAELEQFVIYRKGRTRQGVMKKTPNELPLANEMLSLHEINEWGVPPLYFDGIIWHGGMKQYVQKIPFETLSIGGYGEMDCPVVASDVWIQTLEGKKLNVWYRLRTPAPEYHRYHEPFLWMAELAKHVVDFLSTHQDVALSHFREDFHGWLKSVYEVDESIRIWIQQYASEDFRHAVASQANFLWCQATQVDEDLENHPLWSEICPRFLSAVPEEKEKTFIAEMFAPYEEGNETKSVRKTTVTPYVYECFKHLPCAKFLFPQVPSVGHAKQQKNPTCATRHHHHHHYARTPTIRTTTPSARQDPSTNTSVAIGDVVALPLDTETTWKSEDSDWYGYVQSITETAKGATLGILWLYRPSDTQCLRALYPHSKELFLSDHCNCGDAPIYAQEVIRKVSVAFFGVPATQNVEFFVRQRYAEVDGAWQTLEESHFQCDCRIEKHVRQYLVGATLLVEIKKVMEPVVLVENAPDALLGKMKVRRLLRRQRDYGDVNAAPNEVVFTNVFEDISRASVSRECCVRCYTEEDKKQAKIPPPYNRQGVGDFYFVTSQDLRNNDFGPEPLTDARRALLQEGWDPLAVSSLPTMKGLDIFCGGGNFGRGIEEGGAVHFDWAVDWYKEAIHTYKANLTDEVSTQLFYGSVNDYLTQAMQGKGRSVAQYGQVEVIVAGSPCQGFSMANPNRANDRSLVNISLVASVVAFVDFYRPKYALLENVIGMTYGADNMFALIVSALVGLGYQVRTFCLDAWNFGSPQSRSRVFISIAAPGMTPLPEPPQSHSHPESTRTAGLVKTANGLRTSSRYSTTTPYEYIASSEAVKDLPITDARTTCIPFPDHRMCRNLSTVDRIRIGSVPRFPGGSNFMIACDRGYMPQAQLDTFSWDNVMRTKRGSRCWQRVRRNGLMPTVLTAPHPEDGAGGTILHWDEERLLTIMEVRRGQGFVDDDVLIGLPKEKWKIVGNSVARQVALALGVSLRKAWLANSTTLSKDANSGELGLPTKLANGAATRVARSVMVVIGAEPASSQMPAHMASVSECENGLPPSEAQVPASSYAPGEPLIKDSIKKSTLSRCSASPNDRQSDETFLHGILHPVSVEGQIIDSKTADSFAENGLARQQERGSFHTASVSNGEAPRTDKFAEKSNSARTSLSISPNTRIIRETTISKVTVKTTTTILREQIEHSPEL